MPARREGNSIYLLYRGLRLRKQCRGLSYAQSRRPNCCLWHCTARRSKRRHFVELEAKRSCQEVVSGWRCADELMCSMSEMGQKRKCPGSRGTSVLPSTGADIVSLPRHVRLVPKHEIAARIHPLRRCGLSVNMVVTDRTVSNPAPKMRKAASASSRI